MKQHHWIAIFLIASTQYGCQQAHERDVLELKEDKSVDPAFAPPPASAPPPPAEAIAQDSPALPTGPEVTTPAARLLVYHAEVRLKATSMPRAMSQLDSLVHRSGGYLSAAAETRADGEWRQVTTIRVAPAQFRVLLNGLAGLGTIEEKKLSTDDVTAEHADVAARLQTKRAVAQQYTALLTKAQKIKDILDIEEKLGSVREEIEATESRLKTLNNQIAYSTIELALYQPLPQSIPDAPVVSLGSRVVEAFYGGWQLLTSLLVDAITLWPLLLLGTGGWWVWRRRRSRRPTVLNRPAPGAAL
jgi:hypothetical protein